MGVEVGVVVGGEGLLAGKDGVEQVGVAGGDVELEDAEDAQVRERDANPEACTAECVLGQSNRNTIFIERMRTAETMMETEGRTVVHKVNMKVSVARGKRNVERLYM